jgi:hypothetical protein
MLFLPLLLLTVLPLSMMSFTHRAGHYTRDSLPQTNLLQKPVQLPYDNPIVSKYALLLKTEEAHVNRFMKLYTFINRWLGTPYLWGGCDKDGIDCSCFVMTLFKDVFGIKIQRTTFTQFYDKDVALFTNRKEYQLGDLIFFKTNIARETRNNRITHVGFYLINGYFVQSSSAGVNIANLNSGYWKTRIVAAGRLREAYYKRAGIPIPTGDIDAENKQKPEAEDKESNFEPFPFPEDKQEILKEYVHLLKVEASRISIPELFEFIEKNRYAPYNVASKCPRNLSNNNCLITTVFKDVFNIDFEQDRDAGFLTRYTTASAKEKLSFLDLVTLTGIQRSNKEYITGLYLYNNYFLHLYNGDISITSLADPAFEEYSIDYRRFKQEILVKALENIKDKRKGIVPVAAEPAKTDPTPQPGSKPLNILKKDDAAKDSLQTLAPPVEPKKKGKKSRRKRDASVFFP